MPQSGKSGFYFNQSLNNAADIIKKHALSKYLSEEKQQQLISALKQTIDGRYVAPIIVTNDAGTPIAQLSASLESVTWPFRPISGHPFGFDAAGRDVLARIIYGMRTALTFGIVLVISTMFIGIIAGAIQGYFAGWVDITGNLVRLAFYLYHYSFRQHIGTQLWFAAILLCNL